MDSPPSEVSPDNGSIGGRSQGNHKKRIRVWTEDDRAKHRVFEKGRREAFSDSLLSLARFLPSLTSVKESKLSKHTIVDESLKYHEVQKSKLDELQKTVDTLTAEKEALLAELSGWRECLDAEPAASAEPLEATAVQHDTGHIANHNLMPTYNGTVMPGPVPAIEMPAMSSAGYGISTDPVTDLAPDVQLLNDYTLQASILPFSNDAGLGIHQGVPQYSVHGHTQDEPHQRAPWSAHVQQPLWTQQSYQELPLEFQRHGF